MGGGRLFDQTIAMNEGLGFGRWRREGSERCLTNFCCSVGLYALFSMVDGR
jgi:hypothetical protein